MTQIPRQAHRTTKDLLRWVPDEKPSFSDLSFGHSKSARVKCEVAVRDGLRNAFVLHLKWNQKNAVSSSLFSVVDSQLKCEAVNCCRKTNRNSQHFGRRCGAMNIDLYESQRAYLRMPTAVRVYACWSISFRVVFTLNCKIYIFLKWSERKKIILKWRERKKKYRMPHMNAIRAKHKFLPPFMHIKIIIFLFDTIHMLLRRNKWKYVDCGCLCIESSAMRLKRRQK